MRFILCLAAFASVGISRLFAQSASDAEIAWIKEHAIPLRTSVAENGFEDLQPLKEIIGDARIVSLGESTHGSREIFQMKHRLVEYLATELGFTIFSIEANMPEAYRLNDYVHSGTGDVRQLIGGMYFWTWNTEEVREMVEWMKRLNQTEKKIDFTGFDMQTPDVAMEEVLRFLKKADESLYARATKAFADAKNAREVLQPEFGVATGTFPVEAARGKKIRYSGWIKTENVKNFAGLWWRVDGPDRKLLAFDNMQNQKISGTRDWQQYSLELTVPQETANINFGVILPGEGKAWFDGLEVRLDDQPFQAPDSFDLDFESPHVKGLGVFRFRTYRTELDAAVAKVGKQSLRLESLPAPKAAIGRERFQAVLTGCVGVHEQFKESRAELIKRFPEKEVDWAIQNARIVKTAIEQRGGNMAVRDAAMADNVAWILDQNPGARIVLWSHNFHASKQSGAMGKYLDKKFGDQHLAIGFAMSRGEYQAIGPKGLSNHPLQTPPDDSFEAAFQRTGVPRFFLDLRVARDASEGKWLTKEHPFRGIGAAAMQHQFAPANLPQLFDGIIFIEETSAAKPLR